MIPALSLDQDRVASDNILKGYSNHLLMYVLELF